MPQYAALLAYQLSAIVRRPPSRAELLVTICCAPPRDDRATAAVIDHFAPLLRSVVDFRPLQLPVSELMRRAIGRNRVALATKADWCWFSDCDQLIFGKAFDALANLLPAVRTDLAFPRTVHKHRSHAIGDRYVAEYADQFAATGGPVVVDIDPVDFEPVDHDRAIGGLQISRGSRLREIGYCRDLPQFQRPEAVWMQTKEDVVFRKTIGIATPIDIPGIYRIRHGRAGRDYHKGVIHG